MPELPEVETVRRQLEKNLLGRKIVQVFVHTGKIVQNDASFARALTGLSFVKIDRIGKLLIFEMSDGETFLLAHLRMTGKFLLEKGATGSGAKNAHEKSMREKHTHITFVFEGGLRLLFHDVRKFGYVVRADKDQVEVARGRFGIEPLTKDFTLENFVRIFQNKKTTIKALLLDQSLVAGLGNIYVDEVLFRAKVLPTRRADTISLAEKKGIFQATEKVIAKAIEKGGTTFLDFAHTDGESGTFVDNLQVFARAGKLCIHCGTEIEKTRVAGRGTHFCPTCQK